MRGAQRIPRLSSSGQGKEEARSPEHTCDSRATVIVMSALVCTFIRGHVIVSVRSRLAVWLNLHCVVRMLVSLRIQSWCDCILMSVHMCVNMCFCDEMTGL